jgi:choline dehydrogenase-like flavoprotein
MIFVPQENFFLSIVLLETTKDVRSQPQRRIHPESRSQRTRALRRATTEQASAGACLAAHQPSWTRAGEPPGLNSKKIGTARKDRKTMLYDADTHTKPGEELAAQICIIGSGAAGITLAHQFIGQNKKVILLESSAVSQCRGLSEARRLAFLQTESPGIDPDHRCEDPTVQPLYKGVALNIPNDPNFLTRSRVRVYGGTTNCWGGWTTPLTLADFDRSDLNPTFKWPITWNTLGAFYAGAIRKYCSLGDWDASAYSRPNAWVGQTTPRVAPIALPADSPVQTTVFTAISGDNNGFYWDFQRIWGPDVEKSANVAIYRNANVRFLQAKAGGTSLERVRATTVRDGKAGHDFAVKADQYVLACGGIETPRLLLVSDNLGNRFGNVGKNFMIHPLNERAASFSPGTKAPTPEERSFYEWPWSKIVNRPNYPSTGVFATLTPTLQALRENGIGNFRALISFGGNINFNWEQLPNPQSTVTTDPQQRDYLFGDPMVRVDWQMTPTDTKTIVVGLQLTYNALRQQGYAGGNFTTDPRVDRPGDHHMGTTRMSQDPRTGVVDANCRMHEVDNLYVASSSVFSTGGFANPTLTIVALALRLANHLGATLQ